MRTWTNSKLWWQEVGLSTTLRTMAEMQGQRNSATSKFR